MPSFTRASTSESRGESRFALVASHQPDAGAMDGPCLLVDAPNLAPDSHERQLDQARTIGEALINLADGGAHRANMPTLPDGPITSRLPA